MICTVWECVGALTREESFHTNHSLSLASDRGSSQSHGSEVSSLMSAFPCTVIGATKPKGSYKLLTVDSTPLLVNVFCSLEA